MGRKNRRAKYEYHDRLGFNPKKYIKYQDHPGQNHPSQSEGRGLRDEERRPYRTPYRGEVWFAELGNHPGTSVQDGCRPVLIISNDKGNHHASTIVVLPMTSRMKKYDLPSHVELYQDDLTNIDPGRPLEPSMILAEQVTTIAKSALRSYIGKVTGTEKLAEIDNAVRLQLSMDTESHRAVQVEESIQQPQQPRQSL